MREENRNKKKVWIIKSTLLLLIFLLICTVASETIENLLLPKVETTVVYSGRLEDKAQLEGMVITEDAITIWSLGKWKIEELYAEAGQRVEKGTPLLRVNISEMELSIREMELEKEKLQHERNTSGTCWSRIQEIDMERAILDEKIEVLRMQYPEEGILTSPVTGKLQKVYLHPGEIILEGQKLMELLPVYSQKTVQWEMSDEALQRFSGMDVIQLYFVAEDESGKTYQSDEATVDKKRYNNENGMWEVSATLPERWNQSEISRVQVLLKYESISYPLIIPTECVTKRNGRYFVYTVDTREGIFGDENVVRETEITILEKNSRQIAAQVGGISEGQKIVRYADKVLENNETVIVVEK